MIIDTKAIEKQVAAEVNDHIRSAVAGALSKEPGALVQAVVTAAMSEKDGYSARGETVFQKAVNEMIRKAAKEEFGAWLDENRDKIRAAIRKRMKASGGPFIDTVADKLVEGMASGFYVSVQLKVED